MAATKNKAVLGEPPDPVRQEPFSGAVALSLSPSAAASAGVTETVSSLDDTMSRLADGDRSAFDPIFNTLWPLLLRYATRVLGDPARAEDVTQRALLKLFERAGGYDRSRSALGWAMAFVYWECRTEKTNARRTRVTTLERDVASAMESAEESLGRLQWERAALELLEQLPVGDRALIWTEVQPELAAALAGENPATIRKRRERLLRRLRSAFRLIVNAETEEP